MSGSEMVQPSTERSITIRSTTSMMMPSRQELPSGWRSWSRNSRSEVSCGPIRPGLEHRGWTVAKAKVGGAAEFHIGECHAVSAMGQSVSDRDNDLTSMIVPNFDCGTPQAQGDNHGQSTSGQPEP